MVTPYNDNQTPKVEQVRKMFNNIAPKYDLLNRIISLGLDRSWRRKALGMLAPYAPKRVLDVATGTGDLAIELLKHVPSVREVLGIDISEEMMRVGAGKGSASRSPSAVRTPRRRTWRRRASTQLR